MNISPKMMSIHISRGQLTTLVTSCMLLPGRHGERLDNLDNARAMYIIVASRPVWPAKDLNVPSTARQPLIRHKYAFRVTGR